MDAHLVHKIPKNLFYWIVWVFLKKKKKKKKKPAEKEQDIADIQLLNVDEEILNLRQSKMFALMHLLYLPIGGIQ